MATAASGSSGDHNDNHNSQQCLATNTMDIIGGAAGVTVLFIMVVVITILRARKQHKLGNTSTDNVALQQQTPIRPKPASTDKTKKSDTIDDKRTRLPRSQTIPGKDLHRRAPKVHEKSERTKGTISPSPNLHEHPGSVATGVLASVTEQEVYEVVGKLGPDELKHLFYNLGIPQRNVDNEEKAADTTDPRLKATRVLLWWRQNRGREATVEALNEAKKSALNQDTDIHKWRKRLKKKYIKDARIIRFGRGRFDAADTDDIFVDLTLLEETENDILIEKETGIPRCKTNAIESYHELFQILVTDAHRMLLQGPAGSGKTTLISKCAYVWANHDHDSNKDSLTNEVQWDMFKLVFEIKLKYLKNGESLEKTIVNQLLPGVSEERIADVLSRMCSNCLILFDGYDEIPKDVDAYALKSPILLDCLVIVTSRPHLVDQFCQSYARSKYAHVKVSGFSLQNSRKYIQKFFDRQNEQTVGNALIDKIKEIPFLKTLSSYPILLVMLCLLWRDPQNREFELNSLTKMFDKAVRYLNKGIEKQYELASDILDNVLLKLGKCALEALFENTLQIKSIKLDEETRQKGYLIGILVEEEGYEAFVTFIHKTFQEFCAAKYLAHLSISDVLQFRIELQKINIANLFDMEYVILFCCGLSSGAAKEFLKHTIELILSKNREPFQLFPSSQNMIFFSTDRETQWSFPLLMMYESEIGNNDPDGAFQVDSDLVPLIKLIENTGGVLSVSNMTYIALSYLTLTRNKYSNLWLKHIKFITFSGFTEIANTMMRLLICLPSIQSVRYYKVTLKGDLDENMTASCKSLTKFTMKQGSVSINTMLRLLGCMLEVRSVALRDVTLSGDLEENISASFKSLSDFTMNWVSVSVHTMMKLLGCMQSVKSVALADVTFEGDVDVNMSVSCKLLTEFEVRRGTMSANTMIRLLGCMPSVKYVTVDGVVLDGAIDEQISASCKLLTEFMMCNQQVSANATIGMLRCMPEVKLVTFDMVGIEGDVGEGLSASCKSLNIFTMGKGSVSANAMMALLGCMPSVISVNLDEVLISGNVDENTHGSCQSLCELCLTDVTLGYVTMIRLLLCMLPLLGIVKLRDVVIKKSDSTDVFQAIGLPVDFESDELCWISSADVLLRTLLEHLE